MDPKDKERKKTISCGGLPWRVVGDQLQVCLIKQFSHSNSWGIPKGHMHHGETLEGCALREIREETGIDVELGKRLPDVGSAFHDEDKTVVSWLVSALGSDEPNHNNPGSEVADARWFNVTELPTIHFYQRPLVAMAVKILIDANSSAALR